MPTTDRKTKFIRQAWLTAVSLVVVAIVIFILSLTFGESNSEGGDSTCTPTATPVAGIPGKDGVDGLNGIDGADGLSAYDIWIAAGNTGTKQVFLASLVGTFDGDQYIGTNGLNGARGAAGQPGEAGEIGPSAYQLWLEDGNEGTPDDFLASLVGTAGADGAAGADGIAGVDGLSAYELWLSNGNTGDLAAFMNSLIGNDGAAGSNGVDGLSAYELWLQAGNEGKTEQEFFDSLKGEAGVCTIGETGLPGAAGERGASAYEIWLAQGNTGTQQDFLDSLRGEAGSGGLPYNGSFFDTTTQKNTSTPNLMRYNTTDPWTVGVRVNSANRSRIVFDHPGVYNIQFSSQFSKSDSGTDYIDIWLRKNGSDVPMSNTQLRSWGNDDRQVAAWNFFVEATTPGDYYEIAWQSHDTNISMLSTAANGIPGIPSVILTVTQVR